MKERRDQIASAEFFTAQKNWELRSPQQHLRVFAETLLAAEEIPNTISSTISRLVIWRFTKENSLLTKKGLKRLLHQARPRKLSDKIMLLARLKADCLYDQYKQLAGVQTSEILTENKINRFERQRRKTTSLVTSNGNGQNPPANAEPTVFSRLVSRNETIIRRVAQEELRRRDLKSGRLALSVLTQMNWKPTTIQEKVDFHTAKNEWEKVIALGGNAFGPLLHASMPKNLPEGQEKAFLAFIHSGCRLNNLQEAVSFFHLIKKFFHPISIRDAFAIFKVFDTYPAHSIPLAKLKVEIPEIGNLPLSSIPHLFSTWEKNLPNEEELEKLVRLLYLPPVGGKIVLFKSPTFHHLEPSITIGEQVAQLKDMRREGKLGDGYIHQITVQGRLPDDFKYVAFALILHSPYASDWSNPFFDAPWGGIGPLIHDGGVTDTSINPYWKQEGRTDFLQRIVPVYQPNIESMEKLEAQNLAKLPIDELVKARQEQEEQERLAVELKAYQRLALACHCASKTAPLTIPKEIRNTLALVWDSFKKDMDSLLDAYNVKDVTITQWFDSKPQSRLDNKYGPRYESEWLPIQKQLVRIEQVHLNHPEIMGRTRQLLKGASLQVEQTLGLSF